MFSDWQNSQKAAIIQHYRLCSLSVIHWLYMLLLYTPLHALFVSKTKKVWDLATMVDVPKMQLIQEIYVYLWVDFHINLSSLPKTNPRFDHEHVYNVNPSRTPALHYLALIPTHGQPWRCKGASTTCMSTCVHSIRKKKKRDREKQEKIQLKWSKAFYFSLLFSFGHEAQAWRGDLIQLMSCPLSN